MVFNLSINYNILIYIKTINKKVYLKHNRIFKKLLYIIISVIVLNILSVIIYWNLSVSYVKSDISNQSDCGIVFFHSVTKQGGLSYDTKQRCNLGVELYKLGIIRNVICAGGFSSNNQGPKMVYEYIKSSGVPDSNIVSDSASYSSITNLTEAYRIITQKNYKSAVIISSPTHIPRLRYLSGKYLTDIKTGFITFQYDYSITDIYLDCNTEFIKWIYLLFLPESFSTFSKKFL
ncbi:MAG: YdcF family protein [Ignavibacteriota bacterium]|nr:YdcF family protein [Ignavibacteriota bacterium]